MEGGRGRTVVERNEAGPTSVPLAESETHHHHASSLSCHSFFLPSSYTQSVSQSLLSHIHSVPSMSKWLPTAAHRGPDDYHLRSSMDVSGPFFRLVGPSDDGHLTSAAPAIFCRLGLKNLLLLSAAKSSTHLLL